MYERDVDLNAYLMAPVDFLKHRCRRCDGLLDYDLQYKVYRCQNLDCRIESGSLSAISYLPS